MSAVVLLGGGGHCRSVIDVIEQTGLYSILGVLEKEGVSRFQSYGLSTAWQRS